VTRRRAIARALAPAIALAAGVGLVAGIRAGDSDSRPRPPVERHRQPVAPAVSGRRAMTIGYSVERRPIRAVLVGDTRTSRSVLVVGCIHGNEQAGIAVAKRLVAGGGVPGTAVWIVPVLNPDGVAADTRQNSRGVDLNRNFPWGWRPLGSRGFLQYAGPRPLSEPEARAAAQLILRVRPRITVWFHQPLGLVDLSGGNAALERRFARLVGLHVLRLARYPGSAVGWENHRLPGTTAFVVELPPGPLSGLDTARYAGAVLSLAKAAPR
jgi:murein peptide amidase A